MMKRILAISLALVLALSFFACAKKVEEPEPEATTFSETTTEKPWPTYNPLTGKDNYNPKAVGKRPAAIVVENLSPARPQWAIGTSDIIVEGEVEGGISRMLWIYADYTKVPEKVGPTRSARPPYVMFSRFFDAFYIHWGGSHNHGDYIGGYNVIKYFKVNDFDGMKGGELFGRDQTRSVSSEHRGIVNGKKLPAAIKKKGYRTKIKKDRFTQLEFNDDIENAGEEEAKNVNCKFSKSANETRKFTYNEKDKKYHTNDWRTDVKFQNIIILMDETKYFTVPYKGATTTYVNHTYKGGKAYYVSNGTRREIKWMVSNCQLFFMDDEGEIIKLNKGKSYIGLASSNNGGTVTF